MQIEGIENLNTENVTSMRDMFNGCSSLTSLDLTNFNTAKVTDMKLLFANCSALESLDLSMFNTENVTSMPSMFNGATNLKTLNVSNFNTEKVNNMGHMFANCPNLSSLNLSSFNTKGVEYVDNIFKNCSNLTTIYASENFAFGSGLKNGADMFLGCDKLKGFIEYNKNTDKNNSEFANYKTGYFTKLVGKNGEEKIGAVGEILTAENLTLNDDKDFVAYEPFAAKAASYNRTMKEGTTWATLCLPFGVSLANQNFRAFKLLSADDDTETVELEEIETSIAAGTPVIIKMKDGETKLDFSEENKAIAKDVQTAETANGNYQLQGIYTQKEFSKDADNNCYIVKGSKLMNPAKLLEATATEFVGSKPFRAYMVDKSSAPAAGARMFSISVGGSTTAIKQLESTADSKAEYYDLQGRRLQNLQKGVNIVKRGGKTMKVIIK
jgi:surface protein